ncbi:MAG: glucosamine-6-phosphate isomerase [Pirellulaceae bacterium]
MPWQPPTYLLVGPDELGRDTPVRVRVVGDQADVAQTMAASMRDEILAARDAGRGATLIVPVGPVDQFPVLARMINDQRIDCRDVLLINMDEYLTDQDRWVPPDHPLSFRGFMNRKFYDLVEPALAPRPENRLFPDPEQPEAILQRIEERGGVDCCYGGVGINGHIAFNEPPEPMPDSPADPMSLETFRALPTRTLTLARETRTINSVTVGGDIGVIPARAVTVGMREILAAQRLRFYCNRPWQRGIVRRLLHGPITAACPASLLRLHPDAELTVASYVAERPDIQLR